MNLHDYLSAPGNKTANQLAQDAGIKNVQQIRQYQHRYAGRLPGAAHSVAIEKATDGAVRRWDLRPDDWHRIWPELIDAVGAPVVTTIPAEA